MSIDRMKASADRKKCFGDRNEIGRAKCAHCSDKGLCLRESATPYLPHLRVHRK